MVEAHVTKFGFIVSGHADYGEYGYDIVCSAISALTQTIALSLKKHCKAKVDIIAGGAVVELDKSTEKSLLLLDALIIGLTNIQHEYPEHLKLRVQKGMIK